MKSPSSPLSSPGTDSRGASWERNDPAAVGTNRRVPQVSLLRPGSMQPVPACRGPIPKGNPPFPFVIRSAADLSRRAVEGSAVPRTFPGNVFQKSAAQSRDLRFPTLPVEYYFALPALIALRICASASSLQYLQLSCRKTEV